MMVERLAMGLSDATPVPNTGPLSQIFGNGLELVHDGDRRSAISVGGGVQTMIDVVVNQRSLGFADGLFDGVKLLGEVEARPAFPEHLDDAAEVTLGPLQPFDDIRVGVMNVIVCHGAQGIPPGGIWQLGCCRADRRRFQV
jgi:hypothetical protein